MVRPPGPSFIDLLKLPKKTESDLVLEIPLKLSELYGEIIYHKFSKQTILTGAKGFEQVLKTNAANYSKANFFHKRLIPLFGYSLLVSDGEYWKHRRKIASGAFQHSMIRSYTPIINTLTEQWINKVITNPPQQMNLVHEFNNLTLKIALKAFCSEDFPEKTLQQLGDAVYFGNWYTTRALIVSPWKPTLNNFRFYYKMHTMNKILLDIIRKRRDSNRKNQPSEHDDDLLQRLIVADNVSKDTKAPHPHSHETNDENSAHGCLTDLEILAELKTLIVTGYETTALTLTWMFYLLTEHPEYRSLLEQELESVLGGQSPTFESLQQLPLLKAIIYETMRLYPPIWGISRHSIQDDVILGYNVPAKSLISMNIYALHRNPEYWEEPNVFNPGRFLDETQNHNRHPFAFLPFSTGPRICIASNFALTEAMLVAAIIVQKMRFVPSSKTKNNARKGSEVIIEPCFSLRPLGGLFLRPVLR